MNPHRFNMLLRRIRGLLTTESLRPIAIGARSAQKARS
jgi:hypothetical protein